MTHRPLSRLQEIGQSPWLDNIHRGLLVSGTLARMIRDGEVTGLTSNPTIFEQAITSSDAYDAALARLVRAGRRTEGIVDALMIEDVRDAADLFRPIHKHTRGQDGYVSIEVSPLLANDTAGTLREVTRLWRAVARPNLMVKIPATLAGLPAIEEAIAGGINVNVTLIFSIERYRAVMAAYLAGLGRRAEAGRRLDTVASVASFFVSRIDTKVDALLDARIQQTAFADRPAIERLLGKTAIANAKLAYEAFRQTFGGEAFASLRRAGARPQRPLWASTSTKNPAYPDTYYVEALVGPDTVDTLPPATLAAFKDHGAPEDRLGQGIDRARGVLAQLKEFGIDIATVTAELEAEGVEAFARSYRSLVAAVGARREAEVANARRSVVIGREARAGERAVAEARDARVGPRLWQRDATLWKPDDPAAQAEIAMRLGWLELPRTMRPHLDTLRAFAHECRAAGFTHALLLGMGGSSLAPEVLRRTLGVAKGALDVAVLDSTTPAAVVAAESRSDPRRTLFIVSSKSGGTAEVNAFFRFFWERVARLVPDRPGDHFVAITDPGTTLATLAAERGFRRVFENPPDVGGRFAALTYVGLLPAALMGLDLDKLLDRAERMAIASGPDVPVAHNPGVSLGLVLGALARAGRDKLTLVLPDRLASFGDWLEQLVAESTGKDGRGIVPVVHEPLGTPKVYGKDRVFVQIGGPLKPDRALASLARAGHPVLRFALADGYDLGAEFLRWEIATAVACRVLEVNPFDQPDVQATKDHTTRLLRHFAATGALPDASVPALALGTTELGVALAKFLRGVKAGQYVAVTAYLAAGSRPARELRELRTAIRKRVGAATTVGIGPRFLHSTGQLHKGGPARVHVLQLTADDPVDVPIPGEGFSFGVLKEAQALGDVEALVAAGRPVLRVHLGRAVDTGIAALTAQIARPPRAR